MEYASFSSATLGDLTDEYYLAASCSSCRHGARLNIGKLRAVLGTAYAVAGVRARLRCDRCGSKQVVVTFLKPDQAVGNLVYLFQVRPE
jgi:hypothetical protein